MLLYAMLFLTGYDLTLEEIGHFRQWESRTPGHPEYGITPGVETTTGPLGQGIMNAVGMAIAEAHLGATFNRNGYTIVDHHTYVFCSDGDLMEGASHEAASLAGHLGLGKLICEFHAKDYDGLFGKGSIDFKKVRAAMDDIDYRGWIVMEGTKMPLGVEESCRYDARYLRGIFPRRA